MPEIKNFFIDSNEVVTEKPVPLLPVERTDLPPRIGYTSLTITGELQNPPEQNQELFGEYIATRIHDEVRRAQITGKQLVLDIPTGNTPKAVWPALEKRTIDFSNVIFVGHEEAWGSFTPNSPSDFDGQRRKILKQLGVNIQDIDLRSDNPSGNFLPLHVLQVSSISREEPEYVQHLRNEHLAAEWSAEKVAKYMEELANRSDTKFFAIYGVGTDGHVSEIQINVPLGTLEVPQDKYNRVFAYPTNYNSLVNGLFYWTDDNEKKHNNIMWEPGQQLGGNVGRAVWQGYGGMHQLLGFGWQELLLPENLILAFDKSTKSLAFQLAMEGSFEGSLRSSSGTQIESLNYKPGDGEEILPELKKYTQGLVNNGFFTEMLKNGDSQVANYFQIILLKLRQQNATPNDPRYEAIFHSFWDFANRYLGKQAPVAMLIRLRTLFGLNTELVATPEVIKNTRYERFNYIGTEV